jgi:hypothetical protein
MTPVSSLFLESCLSDSLRRSDVIKALDGFLACKPTEQIRQRIEPPLDQDRQEEKESGS